jgi:hypothetical protein
LLFLGGDPPLRGGPPLPPLPPLYTLCTRGGGWGGILTPPGGSNISAKRGHDGHRPSTHPSHACEGCDDVVDVVVMTVYTVDRVPRDTCDDDHHAVMTVITDSHPSTKTVAGGLSSRQKSRDTRTGVIPKGPKGLRLTYRGRRLVDPLVSSKACVDDGPLSRTKVLPPP